MILGRSLHIPCIGEFMAQAWFSTLHLAAAIWSAASAPAPTSMPGSDPAQAPRLIKALNDPQPKNRTAAIATLMRIGEPVIPSLQAARPSAPAEAQFAIDQIV